MLQYFVLKVLQTTVEPVDTTSSPYSQIVCDSTETGINFVARVKLVRSYQTKAS